MELRNVKFKKKKRKRKKLLRFTKESNKGEADSMVADTESDTTL